MNPTKKKHKSFPFYSKYNLRENDEGPHQNSFFKKQEWWYYNVIFDHGKSELKNWSSVISFATYPHTDTFRLMLHDNNRQKTYGNSYLKPIGTCKQRKPAVDVRIEDSYAKGKYPNWYVYANNKNLDKTHIELDLKYKANSLQVWLLKNTGLNQSKSPYGYYCVMNCDVEGKVTIDRKTYKVKGLGYHDHTWMPVLGKMSEEPKKKLIDFNIWDWFCIHFDNKIDLFIGKFNSDKRSGFSKLIPGCLCISPVGEKAFETHLFKIKRVGFKDSSIKSLKIPTKIHIKTHKMNVLRKKPFKEPFLLDIYFEVENIKETIPRDPPTWVIWETTGKVQGKLKTPKKTIKLNGWGLMETTNNIDIKKII
jgi:predicted secreted hydrolase